MRARDPKDGRSQRLYVTKKGKNAQEKLATWTDLLVGVITIAYKASVVPAAANALTIEPVAADGTTALDLSAAPSAGATINWRCGGASTASTVLAKYRPAACRA